MLCAAGGFVGWVAGGEWEECTFHNQVRYVALTFMRYHSVTTLHNHFDLYDFTSWCVTRTGCCWIWAVALWFWYLSSNNYDLIVAMTCKFMFRIFVMWRTYAFHDVDRFYMTDTVALWTAVLYCILFNMGCGCLNLKSCYMVWTVIFWPGLNVLWSGELLQPCSDNGYVTWELL